MKKALFALLLAASAGAWADGATFITDGPALPDGPLRQNLTRTITQSNSSKGRHNVVKLHAVTINPAAFGANVLTVDFGKYHYRFVGAPMQSSTAGYEAWSGKDGDVYKGDQHGAIPTLTRVAGDATAVNGWIVTASHEFEISSNKEGSWVLELDPGAGVATVPYVPPVAASGLGSKP